MHWHHGGDVEGSGGDFKSPAHSLHHLPRLSRHISGGSLNGYHHRQGQTSLAVSSLAVGGPVSDLPGPAKVV